MRGAAEELATLISLTLFVATLLLWAQILGVGQ